MRFTEAEKKMLTNNVKAVLDFVCKEACPYIRDQHILYFKDDPTHYPIMFIVKPTTNKKGAIEFTRGHRSTEYYLGDEYDQPHLGGCRYNFWESDNEMFAFLQNWKELKKQLMEIVDFEKQIGKTLESFTV